MVCTGSGLEPSGCVGGRDCESDELRDLGAQREPSPEPVQTGARQAIPAPAEAADLPSETHRAAAAPKGLPVHPAVRQTRSTPEPQPASAGIGMPPRITRVCERQTGAPTGTSLLSSRGKH